MAPVALLVILLLMHAGVVVRVPAWQWILVFVAILASSRAIDHLYSTHPSHLLIHVRIATAAAGVTTVIYLTGWGPALLEAYGLLALENVAHGGSRSWRITAFWSMLGIIAGQVAIWQGVAPSKLSTWDANAMAIMGAFVLFFIIRMAGATMEQKEEAESSTRLSEDRFRSLIQNSSDATIVIDDVGVCTYASPAVSQLLGIAPTEVVGRRATDFIHPDDRDRIADRFRTQFEHPPTPCSPSSGWHGVTADGVTSKRW